MKRSAEIIAAAKTWIDEGKEEIDPTTSLEKSAFMAGLRAAGVNASVLASVQQLFGERYVPNQRRYVNTSGDDD